MKKILVTGAAGFIGFSVCKKLLDLGLEVYGLDNLNDYYDPRLKLARLEFLTKKNMPFSKIDLADTNEIKNLFNSFKPNIVINLAAQAGVRYSLENPHAYLNSNIIGFLNILENCKTHSIEHLIYASSSSVYGLNKVFPFSEGDTVDHPVSLYAASKKSNELIAHTYSHIFRLPCTGLRFFTVYGPWGRPDMAYFKFTSKILSQKKIDIYNKGKMFRDYTYIDDIVDGLCKLIQKVPSNKNNNKFKNDSLSPVAPFRILNIGNTKKINLINFINTLETELKKKSKKNYLPMQKGDVHSTLSDSTLLKKITGYHPKTNYKEGIKKFVKWYLDYYKKAKF